MNTTVLDCFNQIYHSKENTRNKNAVNLLRHMSKLNEEEQDQNKELDYVLKRTIRGLGAMNHKTKEINYCLLTSHLSMSNNVTAAKILQIMEHELHPSASNGKSEAADAHFGRILTYGAMIRSQFLQTCDAEIEKKVLEGLIHASKQRSYLNHCAIAFLIDYVLNVEEDHFRDRVWPILEKEVFKPWKDHNLDSLHLLLTLQKKFPNIITGKEIKKRCGSKEIVSKTNVAEILRILIEIPRIICSNHPVYEMVVEKAVEKGIAANIWAELDKRFVKPSKTTEYVSVKLVDYCCKLDTSVIPEMLTPNYLQYIMRCCQLCKNSKKDEGTALLRQSLAKMVNAIKESELDIQMESLKKLFFNPGDLMIEKKTGVKIFSILQSKLSAEHVKELTDVFKKIVSSESEKETESGSVPWMNSEKIYSVQILTKLIGHPKMVSEHEWRLEQLEFLFKNGLCEQPKTTTEFAEHIKDAFFRAIDHKLASLDDLRMNLTSLLTSINNHLFVKKSWTLSTPLTEESIESWERMFKLIKKIDKTPNKSIAVTFGTMNLQLGLQLFQDPEMAISSIDDLHKCYEKHCSSTVKEEVDEDEPQWVEVVVDLMLSLLSRSNHLLRSLVNCVFPHICPHLTPAAVHLIISVLNVNEKQPLTSSNDDSDESEESDDTDSESEEEEEEDDKGPKTNGNSSTHESDVEDEENEEDNEEDDDSDMDEDNENQLMMNQLKMNLQQVLGDAAAESEVDDMDVDEISEEEGKRLDLSLAAAFKVIRENRKIKSKKQSKNEQVLTHFRTRVIDLLEIYIDHSPSMALVLDMIVPLFVLLEHCIQDRHQKPLENRVRSCLTKLSNLKKFSDTEGVDEQIILDIMKILLEKGERSAAIYLEIGDKLPQCCTFLIRCLQTTKCPSSQVLEFFKEKLEMSFKKNVLPWTIFKSILKVCWEENFKLAAVLPNVIFDENVRVFPKMHALELLTSFYQNDRLFAMIDKKSKKTLKSMEKSLYENTIRVLNECVSEEDGKEVKHKFLAYLFMALKVVHARHVEDCWDWEKIAEAMESGKEKIMNKSTKLPFTRLVNSIRQKINKGIKRENENDGQATNEKKKKKK